MFAPYIYTRERVIVCLFRETQRLISYPDRIVFVKKGKAETDNVTTNDYRREVNYQKMGIAALCVNIN